MKRVLFLGRALVFVGRALAFVLVVVAVVSESAKAAPYTPPSTAGCTEPTAYQLFASWGDSNLYTMIPGEAPNNFAGTGWTLTGGAKITTHTLANGTTGHVLEMPSGSKAVSPEMCIGDGYPTARTLIRYGGGSTGSVSFTPFDLTANQQMGTMALKTTASWALTPPVNVLPGSVASWHIMQFTYLAGGTGSDFEIYDFGVDPRMSW